MDIYSLNEPLQRLVTDEIDRGEKVLWTEQPSPRPGFSWLAVAPMLFAIPFTLFALFWMAAAGGALEFGGGQQPLEPGRIIFALFGVPFVLIGLGMMSAPYWLRPRLRRAVERTLYVITDRRAIIFDGGYYGDSGLATLMVGVIRLSGKGTNIRSYAPDQLGQIQRIQRDDGSGDVIFGEVLFTSETNGRQQITRSGFFSIPDVKKVEELLKALAESARSAE